MARYTEKDLRADMAGINKQLAASGSNYLFTVSNRNGYTAVDLEFINQAGEVETQAHFAGGSPRECGFEVVRRYIDYLRCIPYHIRRRTLRMAREVIRRNVDIEQALAGVMKGESISLVNVWASHCRFNLPVLQNTPSTRAIEFVKKLEAMK